MAKQSGKSFGGFSSPVYTTGIGQGAAQVLSPIQPQQLDTTAIQRGIGMFAQNLQNQRQMDAAAKKAQAEKLDELRKRESGLYTAPNQARQEGFDKIYQDFLETGDMAALQDNIEKYRANAEALLKTEEGIMKTLDKELSGNENAKIWDGSEWVNYVDGSSPIVMGELDETARELIAEDPTMGKYLGYYQQQIADLKSNTAIQDPDFSLENYAVTSDAYGRFLDQADENTRAFIADAAKEGYDIETSIKQNEDVRQQYKDWLKTDPVAMGKWVKNQKFKENLSNQYVSDVLLNPDYAPLVQQQFAEVVDELVLPDAKKTTKSSFRNEPSERGSGAKIDAAVSKPAPTELFGGALSQTINVDEDMPLGNELVRPRKTYYIPDEGQYVLEYHPYRVIDKDKSTAREKYIMGSDTPLSTNVTVIDFGGEQYALDKSLIKTKNIDKGDDDWNALESIIAKTTKTSGQDVRNRLESLEQYTIVDGKAVPISEVEEDQEEEVLNPFE